MKYFFSLFLAAALFLSAAPYHVFAVETDPLTGLPVQAPADNTPSPMEESHTSSNTPSPMEASPTGNTNPTNTRQSNSSSGGKGYTFLAPLPTAESQSFTSLADYMVYIYITLIGLAIIFAVIMVVWGGVQYVLGALTSDKEGGKKKIQMAVLGLLLVLLSYLILLAINPMLLKVGLNIQHITLPGRSDSGSDTDDGGGGNDNETQMMETTILVGETAPSFLRETTVQPLPFRHLFQEEKKPCLRSVISKALVETLTPKAKATVSEECLSMVQHVEHSVYQVFR